LDGFTIPGATTDAFTIDPIGIDRFGLPPLTLPDINIREPPPTRSPSIPSVSTASAYHRSPCPTSTSRPSG
ncbi:hypothetical protein, partial [Mycobacterium kansasii]